jgi:putative tryptophan/tyrosine transport system substrate-binding protein
LYRMRRRDLLITIAAGLTPVRAGAQQRNPVIGFLSSRSPDESASLVAALREGLREGGFTEGQNATLTFRWAHGDYERLSALAADLTSSSVAVIVAAGGSLPALAAKRATSTIPIVFTGSDDPVRFGLAASLNRPGGNVTGVSLFTSELEAKRFALLRELVPQARLIVMLVNPNSLSSEKDVQDVQNAASAVAQGIEFLKASSDGEISAAFQAAAERRADAVLVGHDSYFNSRREQIVALAARHKLPAIYEFREFVLAGGLMSYGSRIAENYRLVGAYVGRILKGANPTELPVVQPTKFEFVINLKTANSLGLTIPPTLLARADEVIE